MKLATRMTLALGSCALVLFGGAGWVQLYYEERDLRAVAQNETLLLGRSLQTAFENALRDKQLEDVRETLEDLALVDSSVAVFVYGAEGQLLGASAHAKPLQAGVRVEKQARASHEPVIEFVPKHNPDILRLRLGLAVESTLGTPYVVLEKTLAELQRDLSATRRNIWLTTLLYVLATAALTFFLMRRYVGRPLWRMVSNMKRVRAGDLSIPPVVSQGDEVGEAQKEFEHLVKDLEAARASADQEFEARRHMERALQNAEKLIALGHLSAVMAHEIGSPLQILEGRARALEKHADDAAATRRVAAMLVAQTERITRLVSQMRSITQRPPAMRTQVDAHASVSAVVALLELEARRRQVEIRVTCSGSTQVFVDADQLQQISLNLLRNALDASPPKSTVHVHLGGDDELFSVEISDEGPGIPEADRPHLFEAFFTTKAERGGSGLGLSVVKSLVQENGGTVEFVEDTSPGPGPGPSSGCVVRVTLPRHELP